MKARALAFFALFMLGSAPGAPAGCKSSRGSPMERIREQVPDGRHSSPEKEGADPEERPGRDDPNEFYRPPPRKAKQRTHLPV